MRRKRVRSSSLEMRLETPTPSPPATKIAARPGKDSRIVTRAPLVPTGGRATCTKNFLARLNQLINRRDFVGDDVADVKQGVAFAADVNKGRVHAGHDIFDAAFVNVAQKSPAALDVEVEQPPVAHFGDADFGRLDVDQENARTHWLKIGAHGTARGACSLTVGKIGQTPTQTVAKFEIFHHRDMETQRELKKRNGSTSATLRCFKFSLCLHISVVKNGVRPLFTIAHVNRNRPPSFPPRLSRRARRFSIRSMPSSGFLQIDVANGDATPDTIVAYRREVGAWVEWCRVNGFDAAGVSRHEVEMYREHLKQRGLAVSTRAFKLSIVRRFYDAAVRHNLIAQNPATGVRPGKDLTAPEDKMKTLDKAGLAALVAGIPGDTLAGARDRAIVGLMALHGLRRIEVHRLSHESLIGADSETPYLEVEGKGSKRRRVFLRDDTLNALSVYFYAKFEAGYKDQGAMFVAHGNNGRGQRLSRQALNEIVGKHLSAAHLKKAGVNCHALRHTFGTLAVAGGAKIEHLRDAMGHSNIETTSIYVKAVERSKHNPANFIDVEL